MGRPFARRWALSTLLAALLAVGPVAQAQSPPAPPSTPCPSGVGIGLVDAAVSGDPRSRSYIVDQVDAGNAFSRRVRVCNGTSSETALELYPGAAVVEGGEFRVVEGRADNELTGWISLDRDRVTVPAGGSVVVTARFAVPSGVQDGERYGVVLASLPPTPGTGGVGVVQRVGVRVYLAVGERATTDFSVTELQAVRDDDGRSVLEALVRNTGQRAIDPRGTLVLADGPGGTSAGPFPVAVGTTVGPGQEARVRVPLDPALAAGPWQAELVLAAGSVERAVTGRVTWQRVGAAAPVRAESLDGHGRTVVVAAGLPVLLLLGLAVLLLLVRRGRRDGGPRARAESALPPTCLPARRSAAAPGRAAVVPATVALAPAAPATVALAPAASAPPPAAPPAPAALPPLPGRPLHGPVVPLPATLPAPRSAAVRRALATRAACATPDAGGQAPRS